MVMAKAIADPDEMRRFAVELKRFNSDLQAQVNAIHRQFLRLGETWRDQEQAKFADDFEVMIQALAHFLDASERRVPMLLRKAESLQQYLDQR